MAAVNSIDPEWASSLVGLRVKVPEYWWPGYSGTKLHSGKITSTAMNDAAGRNFMFEADGEPGISYAMRYDALIKYADKEQPNFSKFILPAKPKKTKKRKTVTVESTPSKSIKHDASKLKKLISGHGVDVIGDLQKRLTKGDRETVKLLKSMYPLTEVKKCLLCGEMAVPGGRKKCKLIHDIEHWDYERDHFAHCRGEERGNFSGECDRCGRCVHFDGEEEALCYLTDRIIGTCYEGEHIFTEKEKEEVLESLER